MAFVWHGEIFTFTLHLIGRRIISSIYKMSDSDRSQSASSDVKSHDLNHGKESEKKHQRSHESDSDKSSYSEQFYSDDESSRKNQVKKKELIGMNDLFIFNMHFFRSVGCHRCSAILRYFKSVIYIY